MTIETSLDQEETRLTAERDAALELARLKPTQTNRKALTKAEAALTRYRAARYAPATEEAFAGILDVVSYLDSEGWKIGKTTAYDHWKKEKKLNPRADGTFPLSVVLEYARQHLQRKDGGATDETASLQEQKLVGEIRRISSDAELRELKLKERLGELISREQVEVELASRAMDLKTHLDASARSSAGRIIKLVAGDPQKAPDLISFMLNVNRKVMDNYSRPIQGGEEEE